MILPQVLEMKTHAYHYPVMSREVIEFLGIRNRKIIVDCTVGIGAHALRFLHFMKKDALLIGIDKDEESLMIASERLKAYEGRILLSKNDFSKIDEVLAQLKITNADSFFFDLGISTYQLNTQERGFSFLKEGPLDMRMDRVSFLSAYDLVNNLSENELMLIFKKFGEEHYAKKIAHNIVLIRKKRPIATTHQLAQLIMRAVPRPHFSWRIHPATRVFQALRIAVNRELETLEQGIKKAIPLLKKGGSIGVISFHSLEDRIVKHTFRMFSAQGLVRIVTKKPIRPSAEECEENPASRSAKLRVAERI